MVKAIINGHYSPISYDGQEVFYAEKWHAIRYNVRTKIPFIICGKEKLTVQIIDL